MIPRFTACPPMHWFLHLEQPQERNLFYLSVSFSPLLMTGKPGLIPPKEIQPRRGSITTSAGAVSSQRRSLRDKTTSTPPTQRQRSITPKASPIKIQDVKKKSEAPPEEPEHTTETDTSIVDCLALGEPPNLKQDHRDRSSCPCNQPTNTGKWKIDCVKCGQFWHIDCVGLKGLTDKNINKLTEYKCPFCYVAPVPTLQYDEDVCFVCRNTLVLQKANNLHEATITTQKLKQSEDIYNLLQDMDFEVMKERITALQDFDLHLQHLLVNQKAFHEHGSTVQRIEEKLNQHLATPSPSAEELTSSHKKLTRDMERLQESVAELATQQPQQQVSVDVDALAEKVTQTLKSISESSPKEDKATTELMTALVDVNRHQEEMRGTLEEIKNQPTTDVKATSDLIASLQGSVDNLTRDREEMKEAMDTLKSKLTHLSTASQSGNTAPHSSEEKMSQKTVPKTNFKDIGTCHDERPLKSIHDNFISEDIEVFLKKFLDKQAGFVKETGRDVLLYGHPYKYNGSKSPEKPPEIPTELEALVVLVNEKLCKGLPPVNSILINKYVGEEALIPLHSDNEATIDPKSVIATISLGSACTIEFTPKLDGDILKVDCQPRSAYTMTRRSQDLYLHQMHQGSISGTRYSLTFRALDVRNKNSCCIIGDSNTGPLRFGEEKGTFGRSIPGKQVYAPVIEKIDPYETLGYRNVVIHCGINDIRMPDINSSSMIRNCYLKLVRKIDQIHLVNKLANIFVCPVLPTKCLEYNRKAIFFNSMIFNELVSSRCHVSAVDGFNGFLDENMMLRRDLSRHLNRQGNPDYLHLNWRGSAFLASLIKTCVILRVNGGIDPRLKQRSSRVDGRTYADISRVGSQPQI